MPKDWADLKKSRNTPTALLSPVTRLPPTRPFRLFTPPASRLVKGRDQGWRSRSQLLRRTQQGRQPRSCHRQVRFAGTGLDPDRHRLGLQRSFLARYAEGRPRRLIVVPASGVNAGVYVQAISAYAPHPNAAKLWMEYLYSDEGQLGWLKGYCHPIRFNDLAKATRSAGPSRQAAAGGRL